MDRLSFGIIALGANLPSTERDVSETLRSALGILHAEPNISISAVSRLWRTPAFPPGAGPDYVNAVALIATTLLPEALLARLHAIEADFGRDRGTGRWSSRVLDLDLVGLDDLVLPDGATLRRWIDLDADRQRVETPDRLLLPHPRMQDRGFVLGPLAEIAPGWHHPLTGLTVAAMLAALGPDALASMVPLAMEPASAAEAVP